MLACTRRRLLLPTVAPFFFPAGDAPPRQYPYKVERNFFGGVARNSNNNTAATAVHGPNVERILELLSKGPDDPELLSRLVFVPPPPLQAAAAATAATATAIQHLHHVGTETSSSSSSYSYSSSSSSLCNWRAPLVVRGCPVLFRDGLVLQHFLRDGYDFKTSQAQQHRQQQQKQQQQHAAGSSGERPVATEIFMGGDFDAPTVPGSYVIHYRFHPPQDFMPVQLVAKKTLTVGFRANGSLLADALQFAPDSSSGGGGSSSSSGGDEEESNAPGEWKEWAAVRDLPPSAVISSSSPATAPANTDQLELNFRQLQPGK
jgi:hypothetical protein